MKKFLVAFIVLSSLSVFSQVEFKPGFRGGVNFSKLTNSNSSNKTDFFIGAQFGLKLSKFYTLQSELTYSRQGAIVKGRDYFNNFDPMVSSTVSDVKYNLDYLSLGIINKFTFGPGFQVLIGPSIDFKVGDNFPINSSDDLASVDLGLIGGLGFEFKNGIAIDARFKQGLIDIYGSNFNDTDGNGSDVNQIRLNQLFQLGVSYSFDIKKQLK